jgi:peptidoglycan glycosyltransferase
MERFGFFEDPPLDFPSDELAPSGVYNANRQLVRSGFDSGRVAIGQGGAEGQLLATPLQMAMVAGAIANGGVVMKPHLVDRIVAPNGSTVVSTPPQRLGRAISKSTADAVTQGMVAAVQAGTSTAAQIPGVEVAGKTGTAESGVAHVNTTAFLCFAPVNAPRVAVAVFLEQQHGVGGTTAAPIAKAVMEALLGEGRT